MKQTPEELKKELDVNLNRFMEDIGIHLPPDKTEETTNSLIKLIISYEMYKKVSVDRGKKVLKKVFEELPIEYKQKVQSKIEERYGR